MSPQVARHHVGEVNFLGGTDVRGLDLDAIVQINECEVSVYMGQSPPVGTGLNRPAHVTLYGVYPKLADGSRGPTDDPKLVDKFRRKLERRPGCTLLEYEPAAGVWRFAVDHFSR
jgi:nuclear pore complex protein Nup98-Nup96